MGFAVQYQPEGRFVSISTAGDVDNRLLQKAAQEAIKLASAHDCVRFLVDQTRSVVAEDTLGILQFAESLERLGLRRTDWVAVVISRDVDDHMFFETAAQNRGWRRIHYFKNLEAATEWLTQQPEE
jgi:hypothetical protein